MRIDKFLHDQQFGTRSEVHALIKARKVTLNGLAVKSFKVDVDPENDHVTVAGEAVVVQASFVYYLLNKPTGVITATEDSYQATVMGLISLEDRRTDLFPVGRLDKDTTGILLLTNDGQLAHRLVSPKHHVEKTYLVETTGELTSAQLRVLQKGVTLRDGAQVQADQCELIAAQDDRSTVRITLHQGKYHQIKRMIGYLGERVTRLHRESFAQLSDAKLAVGTYRPLTEQELTQLKASK